MKKLSGKLATLDKAAPFLLVIVMLTVLAGPALAAWKTTWKYSASDLGGSDCIQDAIDELDARLDDMGMTAEDDKDLSLETLRLSTGLLSSDTEYAGAPLAVDPANFYSYLEECLRAGYVANAASTNVSGATVLRGGMFSEIADHAEWLVSVTDGDSDENESITVADDAPGGWLVINTTDKANDAVQVQKNGESFKCTTSKDLWFESKFEIEDVSEDTVFVGLTVADTDVLGSLGNDFMGFYLDQSTNCAFLCAKDGVITTNSAVAVFADATATVGASAKRMGFYVDGSSSNVYVYVDGALVASNTASATIPNDEALSPAMSILTTDTGADFLRVDYINVRAQR